MSITVGSVVILRSGGPLMTVKRLYTYNDASDQTGRLVADVVWFVAGNEGGMFEETFPLEALTLAY